MFAWLCPWLRPRELPPLQLSVVCQVAAADGRVVKLSRPAVDDTPLHPDMPSKLAALLTDGWIVLPVGWKVEIVKS